MKKFLEYLLPATLSSVLVGLIFSAAVTVWWKGFNITEHVGPVIATKVQQELTAALQTAFSGGGGSVNENEVDYEADAEPKEIVDGDLSKWQTQRETDPITDINQITVWLNEERPQDYTEAAIALRCTVGQSGLEVLVSVGRRVSSYTSDSNSKSVQQRFGSENPEATFWNLSTTKEALFSRSPAAFAKRLVSTDRFSMRLEMPGDTVRTIVFGTTGLLKEVLELNQQEGCFTTLVSSLGATQ